MNKILIEVSAKQIEKAIKKLPLEEQIRISNKIWEMQIEPIVKKMRKFAKKNKINSLRIKKICEEVRKELYEKTSKGGN